MIYKALYKQHFMVLPREQLVLSALSVHWECMWTSSHGAALTYDYGCRNRMGPSLPLGLRILTESTRFGMKGCEDAADLVCLLPCHLDTLHRFPGEYRAGSTRRPSSPDAGKKMVCTQHKVLPLFHHSSEICCTSGEPQARDKDSLCFSSRPCRFTGWLGLLLQWLSSSRNSPSMTGSQSTLLSATPEHRGTWRRAVLPTR